MKKRKTIDELVQEQLQEIKKDLKKIESIYKNSQAYLNSLNNK
jgi:hypothetical protein